MLIHSQGPNLSKRPLSHLELYGSDSPGRFSKSQSVRLRHKRSRGCRRDRCLGVNKA